jgi:hypothetical protein
MVRPLFMTEPIGKCPEEQSNPAVLAHFNAAGTVPDDPAHTPVPISKRAGITMSAI